MFVLWLELLFPLFGFFLGPWSSLLTLKSQHLVPMLSVESYLKFFMMLCFAFGVLFQLPIVLHFLAKIGILKPDVSDEASENLLFPYILGRHAF